MDYSDVEEHIDDTREDFQGKLEKLRESFMSSHDLEGEFEDILVDMESDVSDTLDNMGEILASLKEAEEGVVKDETERLVTFFSDFLVFTLDHVVENNPDVKLREKLVSHIRRALDVLSIEGERDVGRLRLKLERPAP